MDASDRIRSLQAKTVFAYYQINGKLATNACSPVPVTPGAVGCAQNYPNYQEKLEVVTGTKACAGCSGACSCS